MEEVVPTPFADALGGALELVRREVGRGLRECMTKYASVFASPRYGLVGLVSYTYFLVYELLSPFIELFGLATMALALAFGFINVPFMVMFFLIYALFGATMSLTAFISRAQTRDLTLSAADVARAVLLSVFEITVLRFVLDVTRMRASLGQHDDAQLLIGGSFRLSKSLYELYLSGRVTVMPKVDYCTLQYLQASVDVVLAPLVIDSFTNCKSALKVFEAGIVGTPACASPSFSYREAIEPGVTGFICGSGSEWLDALNYLYTNRAALLKMKERARSFAREHYYGDAIKREVESAAHAVSTCAVVPIPGSVLDVMSRTHAKDWDDPFEVNPLFA